MYPGRGAPTHESEKLIWECIAAQNLSKWCQNYRLNHLHDQAGSALSGRHRLVKGKNTGLLNRREFSGLCAALGSFVTSSGAFALDAATGAASTGAGRTVKFLDGTIVPALGQGSAGLGKGRHPVAEEDEALRTGHSLGMR
jgi:hypothetical protein